jgi:hypothetical protein
MSDGEEAGPSRRSGRRTPRVNYDLVSAFEGIQDDQPHRLPMSDDDSSESDRGPKAKSQKNKGKGKGKAVVTGSDASEFDPNEDDNEDVEMDYPSADERSVGTPLADEEESGGEQLQKIKGKKLASEAYSRAAKTPGDDGDKPDDQVILDFNHIYDPGHTLSRRYVLRRDYPKQRHAVRRNELPIRPFGLTRLKNQPHLGRLSEIEITPGTGLQDHEKFNLIQEILHSVPQEVPPELWAGEGWWSDSWRYEEGVPQWTARTDVDMSLLDIGRTKPEDIEYRDFE